MKKSTNKLETVKRLKKVPDDFLICSPEDEYKIYVEQQIEQTLNFGDQKKAEIYREALDLGLKVLNTLRNKKV